MVMNEKGDAPIVGDAHENTIASIGPVCYIDLECSVCHMKV